MVTELNPASEKVTENSATAGTLSGQGVRQLGPVDALASAPGGSDSTFRMLVTDPEGTLKLKSQLGIQDPQPARSGVQPTKSVKQRATRPIATPQSCERPIRLLPPCR